MLVKYEPSYSSRHTNQPGSLKTKIKKINTTTTGLSLINDDSAELPWRHTYTYSSCQPYLMIESVLNIP